METNDLDDIFKLTMYVEVLISNQYPTVPKLNLQSKNKKIELGLDTKTRGERPLIPVTWNYYEETYIREKQRSVKALGGSLNPKYYDKIYTLMPQLTVLCRKKSETGPRHSNVFCEA